METYTHLNSRTNSLTYKHKILIYKITHMLTLVRTYAVTHTLGQVSTLTKERTFKRTTFTFKFTQVEILT